MCFLLCVGCSPGRFFSSLGHHPASIASFFLQSSSSLTPEQGGEAPSPGQQASNCLGSNSSPEFSGKAGFFLRETLPQKKEGSTAPAFQLTSVPGDPGCCPSGISCLTQLLHQVAAGDTPARHFRQSSGNGLCLLVFKTSYVGLRCLSR